jgi:DNA-binding CsgD family transcriptional regulator
MQIQRNEAVAEQAVMTFEEIGQRLGITRQTAQQACHRGMKKLKRQGAVVELFKLAQHRQALAAKRQRVYPTIEA